MRWRIHISVLCVTIVMVLGAAGILGAADSVSIHGKVTAAEGPLEGAYVGAHREGKTSTTYVMSDSKGEFTFRGLPPGKYAVFTRIPGFQSMEKDDVSVQVSKEAAADFQVIPETDFLTLVGQASNAEIMDSIPLPLEQKQALDSRCADRCHGASYFVSTHLTAEDWKLIVPKMKAITAVGDINPPVGGNRTTPAVNAPSADLDANIYGAGAKGSNSDDAHIVEYLSKISGPDSPPFPIKFQPRATGKLTRAVVTEYQIPRIGAYPHDVLLDPRGGYAWYSDWRANIVGRVDMKTGEVKEYSVPGRADRPGGFHTQRWDNEGNLWLGQLWDGRTMRFNVKTEKVTGSWGVPEDWARTGTVAVCSQLSHPDGPVWSWDALMGTFWRLNPSTGQFTSVQGSWSACDSKGNLYGFSEKGVIRKTEPGLEKFTEYKTPTPKVIANENRINIDADDNIWYGVWDPAQIGYLDSHTGKIMEFPIPTPWSHGYHAVGDAAHKVGWTVPHMLDRIVKADAKTGDVTEIPLPNRGYQIRNLDLEKTANPPAIWFINQRNGSIVRFQEYTE